MKLRTRKIRRKEHWPARNPNGSPSHTSKNWPYFSCSLTRPSKKNRKEKEKNENILVRAFSRNGNRTIS